MKRAFHKVSALLAASAISTRDISEFVAELDRVGPAALNRTVSSLRDLLESPTILDEPLPPSGKFSLPSGGIDVKVSRLLLVEAGLSKSDAVEALQQEIQLRYPSVIVPSEGKKGFSSWVLKLAQLVPQSELLFIATAIRNSYVHEGPSEWRLR